VTSTRTTASRRARRAAKSRTSRRSSVELNPVFPVLDTLRLVGALAVLTTHTAFQSGDYLGHGFWGTLLSRLDIGVAIFFVLSGFLLSRPYLARAAIRTSRPATGRYYVKRVLRIYPVYAVSVVLALSLIDENARAGVADWTRTLLLADTYTADRLPTGLTQMWSLAVEVAFYAVLPWLMLWMVGRAGPLRPRRILLCLTALVALSGAWLLTVGNWVSVSGFASGVPMTWLPSFLTWFAVGIGLALGHVLLQRSPNPPRAVRALVALGAMPGACWTMAASLLLVASTPLAGPALLFISTPAQALTKHLLYAVVAGLVVLTGVFTEPQGRFGRMMAAPPLRHLGHISYSTFCIHLPMLYAVMAVMDYGLFAGHGLQIWAITLAASLLASELLYRFVERPGLWLSQVLTSRDGVAIRSSAKAQPASTR
jgi:peptidoglycan/LPS O-acetylase OafA/YrhL